MIIFIIGITLYFVIMAAIGYFASRRIHTLEDYMIAGRRLPFFLAVPTIVATWFGAGSSMGVSGTVYDQGFYGVIADPFGCSLALLIAGLFFAAPFRRLKLLTISDLLRNAYGPLFERVATILMIPLYIGTLASQMLAMGYVFHIISGMTPEIGILLGSFIVIFYTVAGGMWAVTLTDFIQFGLLVIGLLILIPTTLGQIQDHNVVFQTMLQEFSTLIPQQQSNTDWLAYSGRILMTGLGAIMGQDLIQRSVSSRSESVARWSAIVGAFFYFALGLIPLFIGIAGRFIFADLQQPELLIPLLAKEFLSPVAFTIFACGLFSAIMSTADSYLLAGTSLITHNIILKIKPIESEPKKIKILRIVNVSISLIALVLAFTAQSIFDLMVHSGATLFVAIFVPVTAALFWKRTSPAHAWSALIVGTISWIGFIGFNYSNLSTQHENVLFSAAAFGGIMSLLAFLISAIFIFATKSFKEHHGHNESIA
jgi:SSS family solute:Na+ symporter